MIGSYVISIKIKINSNAFKKLVTHFWICQTFIRTEHSIDTDTLNLPRRGFLVESFSVSDLFNSSSASHFFSKRSTLLFSLLFSLNAYTKELITLGSSLALSENKRNKHYWLTLKMTYFCVHSSDSKAIRPFTNRWITFIFQSLFICLMTLSLICTFKWIR